MSPSVPDDPVTAAVRATFAAFRAGSRVADERPLRVAVALSGGRDSMVLLDALAELAPALDLAVSALHVHHGLSPNADAWAAFCAQECARRGLALAVERVRVERKAGASLEAGARAARYAALLRADADAVALAHHADDQAETVMLQLLRGAGPLGLAAMPEARAAGRVALLRPLLALPRAAIDARAAARGLPWVDDESNADVGLRRNFLRHEIAPRLAAAFPGFPATLARSAAHSAEAAHLSNELARIDGEGAVARAADGTPTLERAALAALAATAPARARNLLRWFIRGSGLPAPSTARLAAMLDQLAHAAPDARVRLVHAGAEFGVHRGRIAVHRAPVGAYTVQWRGEASLALPHGTLRFEASRGDGLDAALAAAAAVTVRPRVGGERIRLRPPHSRALKRLLQESGVPPWQRDDWPLVWCGDVLAAVPGIGVAAAFCAASGAQGYALRWDPAPPPGTNAADPRVAI